MFELFSEQVRDNTGRAWDSIGQADSQQDRIKQMGGAWQEMAHHLESSSICILSPLQSGDTY